MTTVKHSWNGDEIKQDLESATIEAMERVMGRCVRVSHPRTPIRFGFLRRSTKFEPVRKEGDDLVGQWGSFDIAYAEAQERGTARIPGKFMYQTSADEEYPKLENEIRKSLGS